MDTFEWLDDAKERRQNLMAQINLLKSMADADPELNVLQFLRADLFLIEQEVNHWKNQRRIAMLLYQNESYERSAQLKKRFRF